MLKEIVKNDFTQCKHSQENRVRKSIMNTDSLYAALE